MKKGESQNYIQEAARRKKLGTKAAYPGESTYQQNEKKERKK